MSPSVASPRPDATASAAAPGAVSQAVVALLLVFEFVNGIMQGTIAPLLTTIGAQLHLTTVGLTWITSSELLAAAVSVPVIGRLGDMYGHRRLLRWALVTLAVGSLLVALAPNLPVLLLGRVLQGSESAIGVLVIAWYRDRLPVERSRTAIAWLAGALAGGIMVGALLVGGLARQFHSVHAVLLIPALLAVACVPPAYVIRFQESELRAAEGLDWLGAILLAVSMVLLLDGASAAPKHGWGSATVLVPLLIGAVLAGVWWIVERRSARPLVDLGEVFNRGVLPMLVGTFVYGLVYFANLTAGSIFYSMKPKLVGFGFGLDALGISLMALPGVVCAVLGAVLVARVARLLGGYHRSIAVSFASLGLCYLFLTFAHGSLADFAASQAVGGLASGVALGSMPIVVAEAATPGRVGVASGLYINFRTLGGAIAGGVVATILTSYTLADRLTPAVEGYRVLWLVSCGCCLVAAAWALAGRRAR